METFCHNVDHVKVCGGACSDCLRDLDDHFIFHRALHGSCKFCLRMHEMIPMMKFVIRSTAGYWPRFGDVYRPAWLFKHVGVTQMYPDKDIFDKYPEIQELYPEPLFDDPMWVIYRWLELLPVSAEQKQHFIQQRDYVKTVDYLTQLVK